jgi:hypothetical protein
MALGANGEGRASGRGWWRVVLAAVGLVALGLVLAGPAGAQQQRLRPGEIDTADRAGGQAGGRGLGYQYEFPLLRCGQGEAIVGARIRRGDVLDQLQIACARPTCSGGGCRWQGLQWGARAGNPQGGDEHPEMRCAPEEAVAGIRARVVAFGQFDYAADLAIECATLTAGPDRDGFFRVAAAPGRWHHPDDGFANSHAPRNATSNVITPAISCRPNGAVSAISLGVSKNFVRQNQPVVQAISLYCPGGQPDPSCPETLAVAGVLDQSALVERQWIARGGRTGGGAVAVMEARPAGRSWRGARLTEQLSLATNSCNIANANRLCTSGNHPDFVVGPDGNEIVLPIGDISVPWAVQGAQAQNSFPDSHFILDDPSGAGQPAGISLLSVAGPCVIACRQTFTCGRGTQQISYGPFTITYTLRRGTFQPSLMGFGTGPAVAVTRVSVAKR